MNELERLACGVIVTGFSGTALDGDLREFFIAHEFAGYVLFARNVESLAQVRALNDDLRALHPVSPILAVDQEGGRVVRLVDGVETIPPMMAAGAAGRARLVRNAGEQTAFDLRRAGFTLNFAPDVDLALDARNTVIGTRSFGSNPEHVTALGAALAAGLENGGVAATFKHFPGHGATAYDSHLELPVVETDALTLRGRDFVPFQRNAAKASGIMTAHVVMRAFDAERPATLSPALLTQVLRDEWHFTGVCFTDCMQMDAIARSVGTVDGVANAIAAGADCALVSHDPHLAYRAAQRLVENVRAGRLPLVRLQEAYERVHRLRVRAHGPLPIDAAPPHPGIGRELARRGITVLRGTPHVDPTAAMAISFEGVTTEGVQGRHERHAALQREAPALETFVASLEPEAGECEAIAGAVAAAGRRPILLMRRAHVYAKQLEAVRTLVARFPDAPVVSLREPYDCALVPEARHVIAAYGDDESSIGAVADVLFGNAAAGGTLPVRFDG